MLLNQPGKTTLEGQNYIADECAASNVIPPTGPSLGARIFATYLGMHKVKIMVCNLRLGPTIMKTGSVVTKRRSEEESSGDILPSAI